ncbi:hypothetical protein BpHYR1_045966 [Brachionus plicatilis]|uniref:Uncharacterized protein n=1 Tax=Brachionus plicatilis TaxID=10195 RepID=A0A3M7T6K1_BRAPC|nr:hypothetical protein BpHYR1_045966 [Brachionus plicatilis]
MLVSLLAPIMFNDELPEPDNTLLRSRLHSLKLAFQLDQEKSVRLCSNLLQPLLLGLQRFVLVANIPIR